MPMRVVDHQENPRHLRRTWAGPEGGACCREVCVTESLIRLQICTLGPFVPRIDEHERLTPDGMLLGPVGAESQPLLVERRRRAVIRGPTAGASGLIVPRRH